jgi:hypothetical protein
MATIHSNLPNGIVVANNQFGKCLIATKFFEKDSLVYIGEYHLIDATITDYSIVVGDEVYQTSQVNSVLTANGLRQVYGFDGFMNHSCDPNIYCPHYPRNIDDLKLAEVGKKFYYSYALKEIKEGDEISCDYATFDYTCDGHEITECLCGSNQCRGSMTGFKNLTMAQKIEILSIADDEVIDLFLNDNTNIHILDVLKSCPEGVEINSEDKNNFFLTSSKDFLTGDVIFRNKVQIITDPLEVFILKVDKKYVLLNIYDHFIHREDYREMLGFDTFMNHSCDPNTYQYYNSKDEYTVFAKRDITKDECLSCDYSELENSVLSLKSLATTRFSCMCGSTNCRGKLFL